MKIKNNEKSSKASRMRIDKQTALVLGLTATIMAGATAAKADDAMPGMAISNTNSMSDADRIKALEDKVAQLEANSATADGTNAVSQTLGWLSQNQISGFASASYLHIFSPAHTSTTVGRTFDNNEGFSINKLKVVLQHPISASPDKWDFGYRADLIAGKDAQYIQSAGLSLGHDFDMEQLYGQINVPIGKGLLVNVGKMVTLMGVEVIEEPTNPNWSEGNQFLFMENFTSTGVQLTYQLTDKIDTEFRVDDGWDTVIPDAPGGTRYPDYMWRVGFVPNAKMSLGVLAYALPVTGSAWRAGAEVVGNYKITDKLNSYVQLDYGHEKANTTDGLGNDADWYAAGAWLSYSFTDKVGLALRADFLDDKKGARTDGAFGLTPGTAQELSSLTLTLNLTPVHNFQVRPEVRLDHSDVSGAFNGWKNQLTVGCGIAYLF